jgi:hypothetical protein
MEPTADPSTLLAAVPYSRRTMSTTVSNENAEKLIGKARFSHDAVASTLQTPENIRMFNFNWRSVRVDQKSNPGGLANVRI